MRLRLIIIYATLTLALAISVVRAQTPVPPVAIILPAGASVSVSCAASTLTVETTTATSRRLSCASTGTGTPVPTSTSLVPTVTNTPVPTPSADHSSMAWHAPGGHGGIPAHDHGDSVPTWVLDAGYTPMFDHPANTPNENSIPFKHSAMKGWAGTFGTKDTNASNDVKWYGIYHLDFNPSGHVSRFHSYQLWIQDSSGAVSHMSGWLDFGEDLNTGPNLVLNCLADSPTRPIMLPRQKGCPFHFENWYMRAGQAGWMPDFGFNIDSNYFAGGDPTDPTTWTPVDGFVHTTRRIEFAWYKNRSNVRGDFWTTQFGNVVDGPTDPICDGLHNIEVGTKTYTYLCLKQTIQPTLPTIDFASGNSVQRTFPTNGVRLVLPN